MVAPRRDVLRARSVGVALEGLEAANVPLEERGHLVEDEHGREADDGAELVELPHLGTVACGRAGGDTQLLCNCNSAL